MDHYGRPQAPAARRATAPSVSFLNERPKSSSFSSGFTAPVVAASARSPREALKKRPAPSADGSGVTNNNDESHGDDSIGMNPLLSSQQRPPLSARFTSRPQSGGVRRPDPATSANASMLKPRPRTAREGMRSAMLPSSPQPMSAAFTDPTARGLKVPSDRANGGGGGNREKAAPPRSRTWFRDTDVEGVGERPETDDGGGAGDPRHGIDAGREQLYIEQLKDDIVCLHQLREGYQIRENGAVGTTRATAAPENAAATPHTGHSHVSNMLLMRERRASAQGWESPSSSGSELAAQLRRYNYSSDPAQLTVAKVRLEWMLERALTDLVRRYTVHQEGEDAPNDSDACSEERKCSDIHLLRPRVASLASRSSTSPAEGGRSVDGDLLPFANGCGTNAGSIYTGALLAVLQQAEKLKQAAFASVGEQAILTSTVEQQKLQLSDMHGQIAVFKDVLMRARLSVDKDADRVLLQRLRAEVERSASSSSQEAEKAVRESQEREQELEQKTTELEQELVQFRASLLDAQGANSSLQQQLTGLESELRASMERLEDIQRRQTLTETANEALQADLHEQIAQKSGQIERLGAQLAAANERHNALEKAASHDRAQLRRDHEELERALAVSKKEVAAQSAERQRVLHDLSVVQQQLRSAQSERTLDATALGELQSRLDASERVIQQLKPSLQQAEARAKTLAQELERQRAVARHQENQTQLLEGKLSRSIALDANEWQRKRQEEESTWHQQLAALEHTLAAEKQQCVTLQQQLARDETAAKATAEHAVVRARALSDELATANLCIAERKKQWEALKNELDAAREQLERESSARKDCEARLVLEMERREQLAREQVEDAASVKSELVTEQQRSAQLLAQIESLEARLADASAASATRGDSRGDAASTTEAVGGTPRRQAQVVADLRVDLARARQKIAALEEKLAKRAAESGSGSSRRDKEAVSDKLTAREKRLADEHKAVKKLQEKLAAEQRDLEQLFDAQRATERKQEEDKGLLRAIISLLATKLRTQMALFAAVPGEIAAATSDGSPTEASASSVTTFLTNFRRDRAEQWRTLQQLWEELRAELEDTDWQLEHMKNRLEELHIEYVGRPLASLATGMGSAAVSRAAIVTRPFAEAVAADKETVPVAEQLKLQAIGSIGSLRSSLSSSPSSSPERRALRAKAEEQETFALALAQEMRAMKERYELQLEDLRAELRTAQRLRADTAQRLRGELEAERQRHQQTAAQFGERVAALEAQLAELLAAMDARHTVEVALLERITGGESAGRREATQQLVRLACAACADVRERRERARRQSYCGSSSVTVAGRDELAAYRTGRE